MSQCLLTPCMLMDYSESRLLMLRSTGTENEQRVVRRLLDEPSAYRRWGAYHHSLMQRVAATRNQREQLLRLRRTNFGLLHRQALFDFLRDSHITGADRKTLVFAFYGQTDFRQAVITEHGRYLQSNSSLYCSDYVENHVMQDACFTDGFEDYREQYMEYFSMYCNWIIAESHGIDYGMQPMLRELKQLLAINAARLLDLPPGLPERRSTRRTPARTPASLNRERRPFTQLAGLQFSLH